MAAERITLYVDARGEHVLVDPLRPPTNVMPGTARLVEGSNLAVRLPDAMCLCPGLGCRAQTKSRLSSASMVWILATVTLVVRRRRASSPASR